MGKGKEKEVICILCPLGCRGKVIFDKEGKIEGVRDYECKEGRGYAETEVSAPNRVFTGTVLIDSRHRILLPVRSNKPIPKDNVMECARILSRTKLKAPIEVGEVIVPDVMHTGASMISTMTLDN